MNIRNTLWIALVVLFLATVFSPVRTFAWNLDGACAASPATAGVGDTLTFTATQTSNILPGEGYYEWSWSGSDGLSGATQSVSKIYSTPGVKNALVTIKLVLAHGSTESIARHCEVTLTQPPHLMAATLTLIKKVVNDDGGAKTPADFTLRVKSGGADILGSPAAGTSAGTVYTLTGGSYIVSEDAPLAGYTQTGISGDCATDGSVTLASGSSKVCTITNDDTPPPQHAILAGSCGASPSTGAIGGVFTWSASASGGTGTYAYAWSGDDGLSGATQTVTKSYGTTGNKTGTVVITSGSESITKSCTVTITHTTTGGGGFDGGCSVSPSTVPVGGAVQWSGNGSGGTGTYTYSWSGDENLLGTSATVAKSYLSAGTKLGSVTITSGSNSTTKTCSVFVTPSSCSSCGGGGFNQPNVVLFKKATTSTLASASMYLSQTPYPLASASVYLSQIPYTGVGTDSISTILYIVLLLALSGILTYVISRKKSDKHLFKNTVRLINITDETKRAHVAHEEGGMHHVPLTSEKAEHDSVSDGDMSGFISWLASGDSERVFNYLRSPNHQDQGVAQFVIAIASELDLVYRNRIDRNITAPAEGIRKIAENWDNKKLEDVISLLVGSVDESYRSNDTPIKLAMVKIMQMKSGERSKAIE